MKRASGWAWALTLVPVVVLAAGCTTIAGSPVPAESAVTIRESTLEWTLPQVRVLSEPVLSGGLVILYGELEKQFQVVAVDPATGEIVWNRRAHGSHVIPPLTQLQIAAVGDRVAFIEQDGQTGGDPLHLVVVNASSGYELVGLDGGEFSVAGDQLVRFPEPCGTDFCVVSQDSAGIQTLHRIDLGDGSMTQVPGARGTSVASVGAGLFAVGSGPTEELVDGGRDGFSVRSGDLARDGAINRNTARLAAGGSRIVLTTTSWSFHGSEFDLGDFKAMLGIDRTSGQRIWREPRTNDRCLFRGMQTQAVPLRCRWDEGTTGMIGKDGTLSTRDAGVVLERYDPTSGATVWSVRMAPGTGFSERATIGFVDADHLSLHTPTGGLTVDVTDGSLSPATDAPVLCRSAADNDTWEIATTGGRTVSPWRTTELFAWCNRGGSTARPGPWPSWAGVRAGGRQIVTTQQGLQAFSTTG